MLSGLRPTAAPTSRGSVPARPAAGPGRRSWPYARTGSPAISSRHAAGIRCPVRRAAGRTSLRVPSEVLPELPGGPGKNPRSHCAARSWPGWACTSGEEVQPGQHLPVAHDALTEPRGEDRVLGRHPGGPLGGMRAGVGRHRLLLRSRPLSMEDAPGPGFVRLGEIGPAVSFPLPSARLSGRAPPGRGASRREERDDSMSTDQQQGRRRPAGSASSGARTSTPRSSTSWPRRTSASSTPCTRRAGDGTRCASSPPGSAPHSRT